MAVRILDDRHQAAVAQQPLHGRDRQIREPSPSREGLRVRVHDDLIVIASATTFAAGPAVEIRPRHRDQRIGLLRAPSRASRFRDCIGIDIRRDLAGGNGGVERANDHLSLFDRHFDCESHGAACLIAPHGERSALPRSLRVLRRFGCYVANLAATLLDLRHRRIECIRE